MIRLGFVSNSSSSSFICNICNGTESGYDASLSDFEMVECSNGHTFHKDCSSIEIVSLSIEEKKQYLIKRLYKINDRHLEQISNTLQSYYINVEGIGFPCSFTENEHGFENGIDLTKIDDFVKDVWYNEKTIGFRNSLGENCFSKCPVFKIE